MRISADEKCAHTKVNTIKWISLKNAAAD